MRYILAMTILLAASLAGAQELIEKNFSGTSKLANAVEARREIQDQAAQQVTEDLAKEVLGEEKFLKNRSLILGKIARSSARYIPFVKPGNLEPAPEGMKMPVAMKVNIAAFRQVLQDNGLLNENDTAPVILPLVSFVDRQNGQTERWWTGQGQTSKALLVNMNRLFEGSLRAAFQKNGFYVRKPQGDGLKGSTPKVLRSENAGPEDVQLLGDWFGAPLVVTGAVNMMRSPVATSVARIEVKLSVVQTSNNRPIADVARVYETEAGTYETVIERRWKDVVDALASDLAAQVLEAWQKGSVGSSQLKLVIEPRPKLQEIEPLKERLKSSSAGIRSVRERLVSAKQLVLEVDSPVSAEDLSKRLNGLDFNGRKFETSVDREGIKVKWGVQ